jgi:predicted RNase H-like HicB family nuclease
MKRSLQEILKRPYARILLRDTDGTYTAEILEFPGCIAEGDTPDEAIKELDDAAASWLEAAIQQNEEIPEPFADHEYSGKINLRLPISIHSQAARFAKKDDVSLNQFFASAIASRVGAEDLCERLINRIEDRCSQRWASCSASSIQQWMAVNTAQFINLEISCISKPMVSSTAHNLEQITARSLELINELTTKATEPRKAVSHG